MKTRKIISLILSVCMVMGVITPAFADGETIASGTYVANDNDYDNYTIENGGAVGLVNKTCTENNSTGHQTSQKDAGIGAVQSNGKVETNNGNINYNNGKVTKNNNYLLTNNSIGCVDENSTNGLIKNNFGEVNINYGTINASYSEGTVNKNLGTIIALSHNLTDNDGNITNLNSVVTNNNKEITNLANNNAKVVNNKKDATITNNGYYSSGSYNYYYKSIVTTNDGTITNNYNKATVTTNNGTVGTNYGTVTTNEVDGKVTTNEVDGTVISNKGNVETNKGSIKSNSGTLTTNEASGKIETNFSIITTNKGSVETNFNKSTIKTNDSGSVKENDGTVEDNKGTITSNYSVVDKNDTNGTVTKNLKYINDNSGIVELNYFGSDRSFGYIYNNNGTIKDNYGLVWSNNANCTIEKNHIESAEYTGIIFNNNGKIVNSGSIANNNLKDATGYSLDNTKGTIVNNFGTVTETQATAAPTTSPTDPGATPTPTPGFISAGTIINNYGTVHFDQHVDSAYVKNNYGKLENAKEVADVTGTKFIDGGTSDGKTYYGVTIASNGINNGLILNNAHESVVSGGTVTKFSTKLEDYQLKEKTDGGDSTGISLYEWRNAQSNDSKYNQTELPSNITEALWLYPVYNLDNEANNFYNTYVIHTNKGTISTNETSGVVEENKSIVSLNYGTVTFDGTDDSGKDQATYKYGYDSYVETNYGTLNNAKEVTVYYDKDGKIVSQKDSEGYSKTIYVDAGSGPASEKLYAITYSRNGILSEDFLNAKDKNYADSTQYVEGKGNVLSSSIWQTATKTAEQFTTKYDEQTQTSSQVNYQILDGNGKNDKGESLSINQCKENYVVDSFLYWIDVLDNNKIYNYGEISELKRSDITKAMWLRPVYAGHEYHPVDPGPGGGSTGGGSTGGNETPAILADIPTNTPMTAGDILNDPNMSPETKELLNEILDKNSTGSIIIKEDGTVAVPGPGGIPVDVTIEDDKVTLGTMTKDDIKKAVDSLKNGDSGKTDDKTNDKKDGKTDTKDNGNPKTNKAISIDVSVFKGIGQVEVNNDTLNNIAESEAEGLKTTMSIGSITLDKPAISGVSGILMGRNLILVVEEMDEGLLSKKQKKLVEESKEDENYLAVVDSYLLVANDKIKNLGNGKAILEIKLDALGYKEAAGKAPVVYEIAEDGTKTKIDYEIVDHIITFEVNELSTYLITVE